MPLHPWRLAPQCGEPAHYSSQARKAITFCARSMLSFWFMAALPLESAKPFTWTMYPVRLTAFWANFFSAS